MAGEGSVLAGREPYIPGSIATLWSAASYPERPVSIDLTGLAVFRIIKGSSLYH